MSVIRPVQRFDLSSARTKVFQQANGGYLKIVSASDQLATIKIMVAQEGAESTEFAMQEGDFIKVRGRFDAIYVSNDAQANSWVEVQITESQDEFDFQKSRLGNIEDILNPVMTTGGKATQNAAVTVNTTPSVIIPADDAITGWIYKNTDTVTQYLGGPAVTTSDGWPLEPGETIKGNERGGIWGVVAAATATGRRMLAKVN